MEWNELLKQKKFRLTEPDFYVERCISIAKLFQGNKALDLGFGAGRHITKLVGRGCEVYGLDSAPEAKRITDELFKERGISAKLEVGDMEKLPYDSEFFDICIC